MHLVSMQSHYSCGVLTGPIDNYHENFFPGSDKGIDDCYELINVRGDIFGHCGQTITSFIPCSER